MEKKKLHSPLSAITGGISNILSAVAMLGAILFSIMQQRVSVYDLFTGTTFSSVASVSLFS